jgi:hypothetical protein
MIERRSRTVTTLLLSMLLAAVAALSAGAQSASRDSSGVRLTPIVLGGRTGALVIAATPSVDIGGTTGDSSNELNRVRGAVRLRDGTIVVANGNPQQLRFFDLRGRLVRTAGRRGNGPGEFQSPSRLWVLRGDTLLVYDALARRIVLFGSNGAHLATRQVAPPQGRTAPAILGAFQDQSLLAGSSDIVTSPPRATPYYFGQHVFVYGLDGRPGQDIGPFGDGEHFVQHTVPERGGTAYWDLAFGRRTTIAARGNDILVGDGSTFELRSYSRAGALREILRASTTPERLTDAERNAYRQSELRGVQPSDRAITEKMLDEMPYPKVIPMFKRFLVAADGRIWIQRYPHVGEPQERWVVLDARGQFLDELTMPPRFSLWSAGAGYALGIYHDGDDVEHVRQYALAVK